mmetsp:Transcript_53705/g.99284  ORF Transcript_53705/g.99284 Transcript_53705/m.99284 type:complete len:80 (+) Transcript_53705:3-242(+)
MYCYLGESSTHSSYYVADCMECVLRPAKRMLGPLGPLFPSAPAYSVKACEISGGSNTLYKSEVNSLAGYARFAESSGVM